MNDLISNSLSSYTTIYRQTSTISHILVGNKFVDHLDVIWPSPSGADPTKSSFST